MQLLVLVTGEYGWRHVNNLRQHAPQTWQINTWETPKVLPLMIDYPEDYLPESLPASDMILSLAEVSGVAEMIPEIAKMTQAQAVIAPIDNTAWLPVGLARQLIGWLAHMDVACVTPKPFCSLTEIHYNTLRTRIAYDHKLIREFACHFGRPAFKAHVTGKSIQRVEVTRDACCGCARYVADKLANTSLDSPLDEVLEAGGLHHHHYPCQASMGIDPQYGDTLMHISGNILKDELKDALSGHLQQKFVRPSGLVDEPNLDSEAKGD